MICHLRGAAGSPRRGQGEGARAAALRATAADVRGLQTYIQELDQELIDANRDFFDEVARRLGGSVELQSRHRLVPLTDAGKPIVLALGPAGQIFGSEVHIVRSSLGPIFRP